MAARSEKHNPVLLEERINEELKMYRQILQKAEKQLAALPSGHIHVMRRKSGDQFYYVSPKSRERVYLPKKTEKKRIADLCQAEYLRKFAKICRNRIFNLEKLLMNFSKTPVLAEEMGMSEGRIAQIVPLLLSDEDFARDWQDKPYSRGLLPEGMLRTSRGELVRSKSEVMIAEALNRAQIPYRYEERLVLDDGTFLCPDFHVVNRHTREEFYWEHFGMMGDIEYTEKAIAKLRQYGRNGIIIGRNLLATFETQDEPLSLEEITGIIDVFLI